MVHCYGIILGSIKIFEQHVLNCQFALLNSHVTVIAGGCVGLQWSFGVLMWELMTRGVTPYSEVPVSETRNFLTTGNRLKKPKYCPDNVYATVVYVI